METENPASFPFIDYNNDRSGNFSSSDHTHRLLVSCASNDLGAVKPLVSLISSSDPQLQEYGVTAILNPPLCDENKGVIASLGAIRPLMRALRSGTGEGEYGLHAPPGDPSIGGALGDWHIPREEDTPNFIATRIFLYNSCSKILLHK